MEASFGAYKLVLFKTNFNFYVQGKLLKRKLQDEVAKLIIAKNGAPLSISEHEAIVSQVKSDAAQAHAELLEAEGIMPKSMFPFLISLVHCIFKNT